MLCVYAFFIPFEFILEVFFGIDTIFKPYRTMALLLIGVYAIKSLKGIQVSSEIRQDVFLYAVLIYGIIISWVQMIFTNFSLGKFYNDLFQMSLYLAVFFILKNSNFSRTQLLTIFKSLVAGISLNAFYVLYNFYVLKNYARQAGFMDNPNYLAFSVLVGLIYFLIYFNHRYRLLRIAHIFIILSLLAVFVVAGSRTAFFIFALAAIFILFFQPLKRRILLLLVFIALGVVVIRSSFVQNNLQSPLVLVNRINNANLPENIRIPVWEGIIRASVETNFTGLGIGQFKARFGEFYKEDATEGIYNMVMFGYHLTAHSDYFAILITYGIVGLICYLSFLLLAFRNTIQRLRIATDKSTRRFAQLQLLLLLSVMLFGLTHDSFSSPMYWFLLAFSSKMI